jgi:CBS domain-containing protein
MLLQDILSAKGTDVHTVHPDATLDDVVNDLVRYNIGSLVVCEPGAAGRAPRMVGIITERDILRACKAHKVPLGIKVAEAMSRVVETGSPSDPVTKVMGLMTERRIRHLPIVDAGRLCGIISIGDLVKAQHDEMVLENHYLKSYIQS